MGTENNKQDKQPDKKVVKKNDSPSMFLSFIKMNIISVLLALALIIVIIWFSAKNSTNNRQFEKEKTSLITQSKNERSALIANYESEKDSLRLVNLEASAKIFSWSVRSELLRNNTENLNQLVNAFVKESGADLVQLIDPETNKIILSSDKKFEGSEYAQKIDFALKEPHTLKEDAGIKIITPVMGLNTALGIIIVQLNNK
jgi:flagellar basal body-associated protein FliL